MIREKKDLGKTVTGNGNNFSVGKEVEGEVESSPGNEVQYEVTYVGTAQQVELYSDDVKLNLKHICFNPTSFRRWKWLNSW